MYICTLHVECQLSIVSYTIEYQLSSVSCTVEYQLSSVSCTMEYQLSIVSYLHCDLHCHVCTVEYQLSSVSCTVEISSVVWNISSAFYHTFTVNCQLSSVGIIHMFTVDCFLHMYMQLYTKLTGTWLGGQVVGIFTTISEYINQSFKGSFNPVVPVIILGFLCSVH